MFFVGSVFGTQIFGSLADSVGRLPVLIFANIMALFGNGITVFSINVPIFSISRFISGLAVDSNFLMMYILGEISMRNFSNNFQLFWLNIWLNFFSARIHTPIDANVWLKFVHRNILLSRIDGDAMDSRLFVQLEIIYHLHFASDRCGAIFLFHFAGKCAVADIKKWYWRGYCVLQTSSTVQWTYPW